MIPRRERKENVTRNDSSQTYENELSPRPESGKRMGSGKTWTQGIIRYMARTLISGGQILDNSITSDDVADELELTDLNVSGSLEVSGMTTFDADQLVMTGTLSLNGVLDLTGQVRVGFTRVSGSYSLGETDSLILLDDPVSGTVLTLGSGNPGQFLIIKDINGSTAMNPVKISGQLDGGSETWMSSSYASVMLCWTGSRWSKLGN